MTCVTLTWQGEKAKRRDPRRYRYSGTACPDFRKVRCCWGCAIYTQYNAVPALPLAWGSRSARPQRPAIS